MVNYQVLLQLNSLTRKTCTISIELDLNTDVLLGFILRAAYEVRCVQL